MKTIETKTDGVSNLSAGEFNPNMTELENAVITSGIALDDTGVDVTQLSEAMGGYAGGGGNYYTDSGTAGNYVLTSVPPFVTPKTYFRGMEIVFTAGNSNTGNSVINVNGLGRKNIKDARGNNLGGNFITAGETFSARYNTTAGEFRIVSTSRTLPFGLICLFSGTIANIPRGWALCDGNNGTPDLRNSFVRGAGSTYSPGQTGGSETTGGHALTVSELASHSHTYTKTAALHRGGQGDNGPSGPLRPPSTVATSSTGSGRTHTHPGNVPPFYSLAFIMKL